VTVRRPVAEGYMDERIAVFRAVLGEGDAGESRWRGCVPCLEETCCGAACRRRVHLEATLILGAELESGAAIAP
jgi:hypothetical protein